MALRVAAVWASVRVSWVSVQVSVWSMTCQRPLRFWTFQRFVGRLVIAAVLWLSGE